MLVTNFQIGSHFSHYGEARFSLQITNLEFAPLTLVAEFHMSSRDDLPELTDYVYLDIEPSKPASLHATYERRDARFTATARFSVEARSTVDLKLMKATWDSTYLQGFVELRVPAVRSEQFHRWGPQFDHPVRVLLHARREDIPSAQDTYIVDRRYRPVYSFRGREYSSESLALASGRAENEIIPDGKLIAFEVGAVGKFADALASGKLAMSTGAVLVPDQERVAVLIDLLHGLYASASEVEAMNDLLRAMGSELRLPPP